MKTNGNSFSSSSVFLVIDVLKWTPWSTQSSHEIKRFVHLWVLRHAYWSSWQLIRSTCYCDWSTNSSCSPLLWALAVWEFKLSWECQGCQVLAFCQNSVKHFERGVGMTQWLIILILPALVHGNIKDQNHYGFHHSPRWSSPHSPRWSPQGTPRWWSLQVGRQCTSMDFLRTRSVFHSPMPFHIDLIYQEISKVPAEWFWQVDYQHNEGFCGGFSHQFSQAIGGR